MKRLRVLPLLEQYLPAHQVFARDVDANTDGKFVYYKEDGHDKQMKLGRYIRKNVSEFVSDADVEKIVYKIKTTLNTNITLEVREDIGAIYNSISTNGWNSDSRSCMAEKPTEWFKIYEALNCRLLVAKDENGYIIGRALIWNVNYWDKEKEEDVEIPMLDRIYKAKEEVRTLMIQYAQDKGYLWVESGCIFKNQEGEAVEVTGVECIHDFDLTDFSYYPYVDTLRYYDASTGRLSDRDSYADVTFDSTDGYFEGGDYRRCEETGEVFHIDEMRYVDIAGTEGWYHEDYVVYIEFGYGAGEYALESDCFYSEANGGYCLA